MDALHFAYWLKGFIELENPKEMTAGQVQIVKDHLDLVFTKVTPDRETGCEKILKIESKPSKRIKFKVPFMETLKNHSNPAPFRNDQQSPIVYC